MQGSKQGKNSKMDSKWKVDNGGLCENPKHQCKALLAIILIHTHCLRDIQGIRNHFRQEAAQEP